MVLHVQFVIDKKLHMQHPYLKKAFKKAFENALC